MANLRDIRRKIQSVQKTEQITKAMKMVSAAKLRRTQDETVRIRPYYSSLREILTRILENLEKVPDSIFFERPEKRGVVGFLLITSDRGLCGSFNHNLSSKAETFLNELRDRNMEVKVMCLGKKGKDHLTKLGEKIEVYWPNPGKYELIPIQDIWSTVLGLFKAKEVDEFYFIYPFFKSPISQIPTVEKFLPFSVEVEREKRGAMVEHIFEPNKEEALSLLIEKLLEVKMKTILLESITSEHAARMTAMDNASRNATELIKRLTLSYHKARQEAITKEILDIVNSAEAIKKGR